MNRKKHKYWSCTRKAKHKTLPNAEKSLESLIENLYMRGLASVDNEPDLHVYKCDFCKKYHIGKPMDVSVESPLRAAENRMDAN